VTAAPRIGVTTYRERAAWGVWDEPADLLPASYSEAVRAAGGGVLLLPPGDPTTAAAMLDGLHGLIIAGGADVEPARYAAERDAHTGAARDDRDEWELALVAAALARDLPLLGVCRGMQVLNVALGGTLIQHLPDRLGHDDHCPTVGQHGRHRVELTPASRLSGVLGTQTDVATYHHQAVDRLGADLDAVGWAEDGTVEALEHTGCTWTFGVQWHPEVHDGDALFGALVAAAVGYRERNG
jgi:putative glutamine amidotransferase